MHFNIKSIFNFFLYKISLDYNIIILKNRISYYFISKIYFKFKFTGIL